MAMDDTAAEQTCRALGFPLSMTLRACLGGVKALPFPETVVLVDGACRGSLSYNAYTKVPHYDPAWPHTAKQGEQARLFSTLRSDEFEMRVAAIARHLSVRRCDPCAVVLTSTSSSTSAAQHHKSSSGRQRQASSSSSSSDDKAPIRTQFIPLASCTDAIRTLMQSKVTCLLCEYTPPVDGHHHLVRCIYSPYAIRLETRRCRDAALDDVDSVALADRVRLAPPAVDQFEGYDEALKHRTSAHKRRASHTLSMGRSGSFHHKAGLTMTASTIQGDATDAEAEALLTHAAADNGNNSAADHGHGGTVSSFVRDPVRTALGTVDPLLSRPVRQSICDAMAAIQSRDLLRGARAARRSNDSDSDDDDDDGTSMCLERAVLYLMVTGPRSAVVLWCSQFHTLMEALPGVASDVEATLGSAAAEATFGGGTRRGGSSAAGADASKDAAADAKAVAVSSAMSSADPTNPTPPTTPVPEHQAIGEYIDAVASITSMGAYHPNVTHPRPGSSLLAGLPAPKMTNGLKKQVTSIVHVVGPACPAVARAAGLGEVLRVALVAGSSSAVCAPADTAASLPWYSVPASWTDTTFFTEPQPQQPAASRLHQSPSSASFKRVPSTSLPPSGSLQRQESASRQRQRGHPPSSATRRERGLTASPAARDIDDVASTVTNASTTGASTRAGDLHQAALAVEDSLADDNDEDDNGAASLPDAERRYLAMLVQLQHEGVENHPRAHTGRIHKLRAKYGAPPVSKPERHDASTTVDDRGDDDVSTTPTSGRDSGVAPESTLKGAAEQPALVQTWKRLRAAALQSAAGRMRGNALASSTRLSATPGARGRSATPDPTTATAATAHTSVARQQQPTSRQQRNTTAMPKATTKTGASRQRPMSATGLQLRGGTSSSTAAAAARKKPAWDPSLPARADTVNASVAKATPNDATNRTARVLRRGRSEDDIDAALLEGTNVIDDYEMQVLSAGPLSGYLVGGLVRGQQQQQRQQQPSSSARATGHRGSRPSSASLGRPDLRAIAADAARHAKDEDRRGVAKEIRHLLSEHVAAYDDGPTTNTTAVCNSNGLESKKEGNSTDGGTEPTSPLSRRPTSPLMTPNPFISRTTTKFMSASRRSQSSGASARALSNHGSGGGGAGRAWHAHVSGAAFLPDGGASSPSQPRRSRSERHGNHDADDDDGTATHGRREHGAALSVLNKHPSLSEAMRQDQVAADPSLARTRDFTAVLFSDSINKALKRRESEEAARLLRERAAAEAAETDEEAQGRLRNRALLRRRRAVMSSDQKALDRLREDAVAQATIENVARVVETAEDLVYDAQSRGSAPIPPATHVGAAVRDPLLAAAACDWGMLDGPVPPPPSARIDSTSGSGGGGGGGGGNATRGGGSRQPQEGVSKVPATGGGGNSTDAASAPAPAAAWERPPRVFTASIPPRCSAQAREITAILVGAGFVAVPLRDADSRLKWLAYHEARGGTLGVDTAPHDHHGNASGSAGQLDSSTVAGGGGGSNDHSARRRRASSASALLMDTSDLFSPGRSDTDKDFGAGGGQPTTTSTTTNAGNEHHQHGASAPTVEFQLSADKVALSRTLAVIAEYRLEVHRMVATNDGPTRERVRRLIEQMGYTHFDAVNTAVKGALQHRSSVANASMSHSARVHTMFRNNQSGGPGEDDDHDDGDFSSEDGEDS